MSARCRRLFVVIGFACVVAGAAGAGGGDKEAVGKLLDKRFEKDEVALDYVLYLPPGYEKGDKAWPLVMFLHGKGDKLKRLKEKGLPAQIAEKKDPFILVAPQAEPRWNAAALNDLVEHVVAKHKVDADRIYVTGLSMGGFGTWSLAMAYPDKFAAIIPICGGGNPANAPKIKDVPIWVFHGAKDKTVPPGRSEAMVKALKDAGAQHVKFTLYPDAGHNSWTPTYKNPEVWDWLLKQKRAAKK